MRLTRKPCLFSLFCGLVFPSFFLSFPPSFLHSMFSSFPLHFILSPWSLSLSLSFFTFFSFYSCFLTLKSNLRHISTPACIFLDGIWWHSSKLRFFLQILSSPNRFPAHFVFVCLNYVSWYCDSSGQFSIYCHSVPTIVNSQAFRQMSCQLLSDAIWSTASDVGIFPWCASVILSNGITAQLIFEGVVVRMIIRSPSYQRQMVGKGKLQLLQGNSSTASWKSEQTMDESGRRRFFPFSSLNVFMWEWL